MFDESAGVSPRETLPADADAVERIGAAVRRERRDAFDRLEAIADLIAYRHQDEVYTLRQRWVVDGWASIQAEVAAASGCSIRAAGRAMWTAWDLRTRMPRVNAVFGQGLLSVQVVSAITFHTHFITDPAVADAVDAELARQSVGFGVFSVDKCVAAIRDVVASVDPDAVRRSREKLRGRGLRFGKADDVTGTTSVFGALSTPDAAVVQARLEQMAATVCGNDPRTARQRLADAAGALARGQTGLDCLCGSDECDAPDPGESLARLHLYIVGDEHAADTPADPDVHGGPERDDDDDEPWWAHAEPAAEREPVAEREPEPDPSSARRTAHSRAPRSEPSPPVVSDRESNSAAPQSDPAPAESAAQAEPGSAPGVDPFAVEPDPEGQRCRQPDTDAAGEEGDRPSKGSARAPDPPPLKRQPGLRGYGPAALILGGGRLTPAQVGDLVRGGAQVRRIRDFRHTEAQPRYRFSAALAAYIRARDLHCRWPTCEKPADRCDIDHTDPHPHGSTHPSNGKCYCRFNHLLKTFWGGENGWSDIQLPDGTIIVTSPTGHTYRSVPDSRRLFPWLTTDTGPAPPGPAEQKQESPDKGLKMPTRKATRDQQHQYRINTERKRNRQQREEHGGG